MTDAQANADPDVCLACHGAGSSQAFAGGHYVTTLCLYCMGAGRNSPERREKQEAGALLRHARMTVRGLALRAAAEGVIPMPDPATDPVAYALQASLSPGDRSLPANRDALRALDAEIERLQARVARLDEHRKSVVARMREAAARQAVAGY